MQDGDRMVEFHKLRDFWSERFSSLSLKTFKSNQALYKLKYNNKIKISKILIIEQFFKQRPVWGLCLLKKNSVWGNLWHVRAS